MSTIFAERGGFFCLNNSFLSNGPLHVSAVHCRLVLGVSSNFSVACSLPYCSARALFDTYGKWTDCGGLILWSPKSPDLIPVDTLIRTTRQSGFNSSRAQRFFSPSCLQTNAEVFAVSVNQYGGKGWGLLPHGKLDGWKLATHLRLKR